MVVGGAAFSILEDPEGLTLQMTFEGRGKLSGQMSELARGKV